MPLIVAIVAGLWFLSSRTSVSATAAPATAAVSTLGQPSSVIPNEVGEYTVTQPTAAAQPSAPNQTVQKLEGIGTNTSVNLAGTAIKSVVTGASGLGASLLAGAETAGIATVAFLGVEGVSNLFSCGTLTQIGCQKRSDANTQIKGIEMMKQAMYAVETGQASVAAAAAAIQSIAQQIYNAYENKASGNSFGMDVRGSDAGIPDNSLSAQYMLGQQTSLTAMTQAFVNYLPTLSAAAAAGGADTSLAAAPQPPASGSGMNGVGQPEGDPLTIVNGRSL